MRRQCVNTALSCFSFKLDLLPLPRLALNYYVAQVASNSCSSYLRLLSPQIEKYQKETRKRKDILKDMHKYITKTLPMWQKKKEKKEDHQIFGNYEFKPPLSPQEDNISLKYINSKDGHSCGKPESLNIGGSTNWRSLLGKLFGNSSQWQAYTYPMTQQFHSWVWVNVCLHAASHGKMYNHFIPKNLVFVSFGCYKNILPAQ